MSSEWLDRSVLVTGASGVVGSSLTQALADRGARVIVLLRDWVADSWLILSGTHRRVVLVRGEATDIVLLERALSEYEIEVIFHLAAQTIVTIANHSPLSTFEANVRGTWNLLEAARHCPTVRAVVVASSDKAYGEKADLPYREDDPLRARHPYDVSKACADLIAQAYHQAFGLPLGITRCGNVYGQGDLNWSRLVPGTMRSLWRGERPIIRSDGTPAREYIYVQDIVCAYITLAEALLRGDQVGEAFNFGNETPVSVLDMVAAITRVAGRADLPPHILGTGKLAGEIDRQWLSSSKARQRLGWHPAYTLEEGLGETWAWYRDFFSAGQDL